MELNATLLRNRDEALRENTALEKKLTAVSNALSKAQSEVRASQAQLRVFKEGDTSMDQKVIGLPDDCDRGEGY
jgi:signal transduction histidine kinase